MAVCLDLSKAFDIVWQEGMLLQAGVWDKRFHRLRDFLFNRSARVRVEGIFSNLIRIREGVPQVDTVLTTLFLVKINDITATVPRHAWIILHAGDFAVWGAFEHTTTAVYRIQMTIDWVQEKTSQWVFHLNKNEDCMHTLLSLNIKGKGLSQACKRNGPRDRHANSPCGDLGYTAYIKILHSSYRRKIKTVTHDTTGRNQMGRKPEHLVTGLYRCMVWNPLLNKPLLHGLMPPEPTICYRSKKQFKFKESSPA